MISNNAKANIVTIECENEGSKKTELNDSKLSDVKIIEEKDEKNQLIDSKNLNKNIE